MRYLTPTEIEQWSSFKRPLDCLFSLARSQHTLELGAGDFSTPYFLENSTALTSIETQKEWFDKVEEKYSMRSNFKLLYLGTDEAIYKYIRENYQSFDLAFVDHVGDRKSAASLLIDLGVPIVAMHDFTEEEEAGVRNPGNYQLIHNRHKHFNPTGIYLLKPIAEKLGPELVSLINNSPTYSWR